MIASLIANGETMPSRTTAGANRSRTAKKEPITAPADASSRLPTAASRNGRATNGVIATQIAAAMTIRPSRRGSGRRSARRPPSQYPNASPASTMPIRFAQTIVEEPKYGASSLEAAISVASEPMPAPKTSAARANCRFFMPNA